MASVLETTVSGSFPHRKKVTVWGLGRQLSWHKWHHGYHCGSLSNHGAPPSDPLGLALLNISIAGKCMGIECFLHLVQLLVGMLLRAVRFPWRFVSSSQRMRMTELLLLIAAAANMMAGIIASLRVAGKRRP